MTYQSKTNLAKLKIKSGYMLFLHTDYSLLLEDSLDFKIKGAEVPDTHSSNTIYKLPVVL